MSIINYSIVNIYNAICLFNISNILKVLLIELFNSLLGLFIISSVRFWNYAVGYYLLLKDNPWLIVHFLLCT